MASKTKLITEQVLLMAHSRQGHASMAISVHPLQQDAMALTENIMNLPAMVAMGHSMHFHRNAMMAFLTVT
ncbi:hypothetical protein MSG28_014889 [Choristoneura fumiferana]|uniref:Uncharacterized protein n=1 Tax=Choristoneura fumiferana TaxID=7141 RepID=A0ACC0KY71_CHOFU|nr:hypothetical protein MSG28_014889 [Choristoneura fumiferana]